MFSHSSGRWKSESSCLQGQHSLKALEEAPFLPFRSFCWLPRQSLASLDLETHHVSASFITWFSLCVSVSLYFSMLFQKDRSHRIQGSPLTQSDFIFVAVVQSLSHVRLFATPWTCQTSLSIINSRSLLRLMSLELVMPSNHLILSSPSLQH